MDYIIQSVLQEVGKELLHLAGDKIIEAQIEKIKQIQQLKELENLPAPNARIFIVDKNGIVYM